MRVVIEATPRKAFATAIDWPGWSRGARTAEEAIQALLDCAPRYELVARRAGVVFRPPHTVADIEIVERLTGDASTDFGIPAARLTGDDDPISSAELTRLLGLLEAAWTTFDAAVQAAAGTTLRLGPRGGGRGLPKIVDHLRGADEGYLRSLGAKPPAGDGTVIRRAFVEALTARATGQPLAHPNQVRRPWMPRYAIRRSAWHALDHAWEIEDRSA